MDDKIIITNSDRQLFKRCRRKHLFESHLKMNLVPEEVNPHLNLGTLVHKGLEWYYVDEFKEEEFKKYGFDLDLYDDVVELGLNMLKNYFNWAPSQDKFEVVDSEYKFEVPVIAYDKVKLPFNSRDDWLFYFDSPVVYRGMIDLIVEELDGLHIMDHKTTKQFDNEWFLDTDEQLTSYMWALKMEKPDLILSGGYYNELLKQVPQPIEPLSKRRDGRLFSTNRRNRVLLEDFVKALDEAEEDKDKYEDYLEYLGLKGNPYFRRTHVYRNAKELELIGRNIFYEAMDILTGHPYPNPTKLNCNGCPYMSPCKAVNDGGDWQLLLDMSYIQKEYRTVE